MKIGDVVQARSGGPKMTVELVYDSVTGMKEPRIDCVWFLGAELMHGSFPPKALRVLDPKPKKPRKR